MHTLLYNFLFKFLLFSFKIFHRCPRSWCHSHYTVLKYDLDQWLCRGPGKALISIACFLGQVMLQKSGNRGISSIAWCMAIRGVASGMSAVVGFSPKIPCTNHIIQGNISILLFCVLFNLSAGNSVLGSEAGEVPGTGPSGFRKRSTSE